MRRTVRHTLGKRASLWDLQVRILSSPPVGIFQARGSRLASLGGQFVFILGRKRIGDFAKNMSDSNEKLNQLLADVIKKPITPKIFLILSGIFFAGVFIIIPAIQPFDTCGQGATFPYLCISLVRIFFLIWTFLVPILFFIIILLIFFYDYKNYAIAPLSKKVLKRDAVFVAIITFFTIVFLGIGEELGVVASIGPFIFILTGIIIHSVQLFKKVFYYKLLLLFSMAGLVLFIASFNEFFISAFNEISKKSGFCKIIIANTNLAKETQAICYTNRALEKNDSKWCEYIVNTNVDFKSYCYSKVGFNFAKSKDNPNLCEMIKDENNKKDCYYFFAKEKGNSDICPKTSQPEVCYQEIGILNSDPKICDNIVDEEYVKLRDVRDVCYLGASKNKSDQKICDKITRQYLRQECYLGH